MCCTVRMWLIHETGMMDVPFCARVLVGKRAAGVETGNLVGL